MHNSLINTILHAVSENDRPLLQACHISIDQALMVAHLGQDDEDEDLQFGKRGIQWTDAMYLVERGVFKITHETDDVTTFALKGEIMEITQNLINVDEDHFSATLEGQHALFSDEIAVVTDNLAGMTIVRHILDGQTIAMIQTTTVNKAGNKSQFFFVLDFVEAPESPFAGMGGIGDDRERFGI